MDGTVILKLSYVNELRDFEIACVYVQQCAAVAETDRPTVTSFLNSSVAAGVSSGNCLYQMSFRLMFGGCSLRNE